LLHFFDHNKFAQKKSTFVIYQYNISCRVYYKIVIPTLHFKKQLSFFFVKMTTIFCLKTLYKVKYIFTFTILDKDLGDLNCYQDKW